jgi:hypothetical protein
MMKP